ncbi:class I SAM-dependent methyltransferase [Caulobacter sp. RL271]|uniref:Methyltransferase domain-containing protein n=1 Tax=Caulobacter segnis TaxID=88688 RepID=A0ABY4ZR60_9CAUL|nr:class I SAM-dependent methyltransferase [Caulobacter segnis]USQ95288.1 methyltransferase domain-containing protein [Caulobacter segnis]
MQQGDFTQLARAYVHRPAYSAPLIDALVALTGDEVADIGAGTGKLTQMLAARGRHGHAVEPNAAMRAEGQALNLERFAWRAGSAEETSLAEASVDWVTMASAFHWADAPRALAEFHRILRPSGRLTLLWNPRDLARDTLQADIERDIATIAPGLKRRSSGAPAYTEGLEDILLGSGLFTDLVFLEAPHVEPMSVERHLGAWRSVNDIQAQAGPQAWAKILAAIEQRLEGLGEIEVRYRTRAWTVRKA